MKRFGIVGAILALVMAAAFLVSGAAAANLSSLSASTTTVPGGKSVTAMLKLDAAAPTSGQVVSLSSSDTTLATVPSSVTVGAGRTSASVTIKTKGVAATESVTISATLNGATKTLRLTLTRSKLASLTVPKSIAGASTASGTVKLDGYAPTGGFVVDLATSGGVATVPDSVTIAAGKGSATFAISSPIVTSSSTTTITASLDGISKTGTVSIGPPTVSAVSFSPTKIGEDITSTGTVKLTGPAPSGGVRVTLATTT